MTTSEITAAVERLWDLNPSAETLPVTLRMALGANFTVADLDAAADLDLLTVEQYQKLDRWRRAHESAPRTHGGRR